MDENRAILPSMMFLGIMDMMMFSTMMGCMGLAMTSFMPDQYIDGGGHDMSNQDMSHDGGHDTGQDFSGGSGFGDGGPGDMNGFDVNF